MVRSFNLLMYIIYIDLCLSNRSMIVILLVEIKYLRAELLLPLFICVNLGIHII
jgi:hypothetical protein